MSDSGFGHDLCLVDQNIGIGLGQSMVAYGTARCCMLLPGFMECHADTHVCIITIKISSIGQRTALFSV